jgi:hypothetical protein
MVLLCKPLQDLRSQAIAKREERHELIVQQEKELILIAASIDKAYSIWRQLSVPHATQYHGSDSYV